MGLEDSHESVSAQNHELTEAGPDFPKEKKPTRLMGAAGEVATSHQKTRRSQKSRQPPIPGS
jgi:hypothetical protein